MMKKESSRGAEAIYEVNDDSQVAKQMRNKNHPSEFVAGFIGI
jgi:hypothetical protein